ncbi:DNA-binding protein [Bradyrhizobium sp. GCM10027634]|uniref:DNA-binding protein n=1 Tax=unclassified Bradyrhizobium TaxID=2631580 RepID=UPI00263B440D|nr:DNA-binding protein [Bradyrhizobium sp. WYCCWR 12677]MDN5003817.1 DNA-binding protein [Bradyrhizobium sp. WYCCWR 12677]
MSESLLPLVATVNQSLMRLQVSRPKLYELLNSGEIESFTEGRSRKIMIASMDAYVQRRLAAEAARRGRST